MSIIELKNVTKEFKIASKCKNFREYLFNRNYYTIEAVKDVDFSINKGELVGYIGPNGAGKSTTIKMMTGILATTRGEIKVLGLIHHQTISYSLYIHYQRFYIFFYELGKYINRPARQLSLGQRVRLDIALSFLHNPDIVFLDEPTIGLDLVVKKNIRKFIKELSVKRNITLVLTTHDMKDIEVVCDRLIMIDEGKKVMDMPVDSVKKSFESKNIIKVTYEDNVSDIVLPNMDVLRDGEKYSVKYDKNIFSPGEIISKLSKYGNIVDIDIQDPDIEDIISDIYSGKIEMNY